jgi:flagellar assembly protein FliH
VITPVTAVPSNKRLPDDVDSDERILKETLQEATLRAEKTGHEEGYRRGLAQGRAELEAEIKRLACLCAALEEDRHNQLDAWASLSAEFAYTVACRVLGRFALRPEAVQAMAEQFLSEHALNGPVVLRVHAQDAAFLEKILSQAQQHRVQIRPDAEITYGGCRLELPDGGRLDARLETQMAELKTALLAARSKGSLCADY